MLGNDEDEHSAWRRVEHHANREATHHGLNGGWRTMHIATELIDKHVRVLKHCFDQATDAARSELINTFASIELKQVVNGLLAAIREMLVVYVGSISAGALIGGALSGGIGIGVGAAMGAELATLWLSLIGLKCLATALLKNVELLMSDYGDGLAQAWQAVYYDPNDERVIVNDDKARRATWCLTNAHVRMMKALLVAIVAYLSKGQLKVLATEARSGKLGNAFGDWLEQYGSKLKDHPALQPRQTVERVRPTTPMLVPKQRAAADPKTGLHNQQWEKVEVPRGSFRTVRTVDMKNLSSQDQAAYDALFEQGWLPEKIEEILNSGDNFKVNELQPGEKLYGFNTAGVGKNLNKSAYWLDEAGHKDVESKFCENGVWDKEGVKNYLALPCFNRADAIDVVEVTEPTTIVESRVGKATELIQYTDDSGYTTGLLGKIMPGGGDQVTAAPSALKLPTGAN